MPDLGKVGFAEDIVKKKGKMEECHFQWLVCRQEKVHGKCESPCTDYRMQCLRMLPEECASWNTLV